MDRGSKEFDALTYVMGYSSFVALLRAGLLDVLKVKVKFSRYRPNQALGDPEG